ncbi:hypothetical protein C6P46_005237 [Rhodotorula mucilaginosa]|uniref:F-box domain-containing protein n=1 Tax=Rhodotorula mucilaginosa TaxID=5537 RepID=A0A9P6W0T2_RHOMI|nr:hypothetical protein C6P46_005237 [Rhodotorula mucilaginosa]TKA54432.1 hypothetical protein B0A53_03125 [Rhodotorula sp. CCFEE 5036]
MSSASLARFSELPDELLRHVILLSAEYDHRPADPLSRRRRRVQLESLSLVCLQWRTLAQRALLGSGPTRPVRIYHAKQLVPLVELLEQPEQGLGPLVSHLDVQLWGEPQDHRLLTTLRACTRLEELCLTHLERVRLDEVASGSELASLSLRQCTLVSSYYPDPPPELPSSRIPPRLAQPGGAFATLSRLDLRLCSLRRDFLPLEFLLQSSSSSSSSPPALLPNLRHLLLFTGSHDQSPKTVRALVRSVAAQLRSLSLDYTAYEILFPDNDSRAEEAVEDKGERPMRSLDFPTLRCYGTYWDAAYHTLVGLPIALPALTIPHRTGRTESPTREPPPGPSYLHTALYPAQLESLAATLESVLTNPELRAANAWTGVEQWRVEGTLADLDLVDHEDEEDDEDDEPDMQERDESDDEGDAAGGLETGHRARRAGSSAPPPPPPLSHRRESRITSLVQLARSHANLDLKIEPPGGSGGDPIEEEGSRAAGGRRQPLQRATFERGFGTSWWRFVDEVERELL